MRLSLAVLLLLLTGCGIKKPVVTPVSGLNDLAHVKIQWVVSCPSDPDVMRDVWIMRPPTEKEAMAYCKLQHWQEKRIMQARKCGGDVYD